jgi:hypothetical protein
LDDEPDDDPEDPDDPDDPDDDPPAGLRPRRRRFAPDPLPPIAR